VGRLTVLHFWDGRRQAPRRIRLNFVKKLQRVCNLKIYGPGENDKEFSPISYNNKMTASDLVKEFNADVFLFPEHTIVNMKKLLPKELKKINIPVALIEVDYHNLENKNFYRENGIDLVIHRGYCEKLSHTPSVWLPNSVNKDEFYTNPNSNYLDNRKNIIGFIGGGYKSKCEYYSTRTKAINILKEAKLLEYRGYVGFDPYVETLKKYIGCLSCSCNLHMAPAKTYEIAASGSALLTQWFYGSEELFGCKKCFFTYRDDCGDIVEVAKEILSDREEVYRVTRNALEQIHKKHLDRYRIVELYNILKALVEGRRIPKKWGR